MCIELTSLPQSILRFLETRLAAANTTSIAQWLTVLGFIAGWALVCVRPMALTKLTAPGQSLPPICPARFPLLLAHQCPISTRLLVVLACSLPLRSVCNLRIFRSGPVLLSNHLLHCPARGYVLDRSCFRLNFSEPTAKRKVVTRSTKRGKASLNHYGGSSLNGCQ